MSYLAPPALFDFIRDEWAKLPGNSKPWGIWVAAHEPLVSFSPVINSRLMAVWFMEQSKVEQRETDEYLRLHHAQFGGEWQSRHFYRASGLALAAFAPYAQTDEFYLEITWDSLNGHGYRVRVGETGTLEIVAVLWVS